LRSPSQPNVHRAATAATELRHERVVTNQGEAGRTHSSRGDMANRYAPPLVEAKRTFSQRNVSVCDLGVRAALAHRAPLRTELL
jgi:hypothetical protein